MMRLRKGMGFTLLEVVIAALLLSGIIAVCFNAFVISRRIIVMSAQRQEATSFAVDVFENLKGNNSFYNSALSSGAHTNATDPDICNLPRGDFRDRYGGTREYAVEDIPCAGGTVAYKKITIKVNWQKPKL